MARHGTQLTLADEASLPQDQGGATVNPVGKLSKSQMKNDAMAKESQAKEKAAKKNAEEEASAARVAEMHNKTTAVEENSVPKGVWISTNRSQTVAISAVAITVGATMMQTQLRQK